MADHVTKDTGNRDTLDQLARDAGVENPEQLASKQEVADAINAATGATAPASTATNNAMPILTPGDAGANVMRLALALEDAGYPNTVAQGTAPAVLTDQLMDLVREFQAEHGHDPRKPQHGGEVSPFRAMASGVVDAETWALLLGAATVDRLTAAGGA